MDSIIYSFLLSISYSSKYRYFYLQSHIYPVCFRVRTRPQLKQMSFITAYVARLESFPAKRTVWTENKRLFYIWLPQI